MFIRVKPSGRYKYLQLVENTHEGKKVKQLVLFTCCPPELLSPTRHQG
jgi:hypothetical protein